MKTEVNTSCIFPGCERDTGGLDKCFYHHMLTFHQHNRIVMNPQPLLELNQVKSNNDGQWCHWERGWGNERISREPLLNQPRHVCGVEKNDKDGLWYWLIDS